MKGWTYGAEHELGDWDQRKGLPSGFKMDRRDITCMNTRTGIAADPSGKMYPYGGEINTPPTDTVEGQLDALAQICASHPEATINHRSNLHLHIRVPGLCDDLPALKRIARYNSLHLRELLARVEPIPQPSAVEYPNPEELAGAKRRAKRRRVSHQTVLTTKRTEGMLATTTTEEFFRKEVPADRQGNPLWHCQPRAAVNLRQLRETDTIEFRHFPGTLEPESLRQGFIWCQNYLTAALDDTPPALWVPNVVYFPLFPVYVHWRECNYRLTCHDGTVSRTDILANIQKIEEEHAGIDRLSWIN